MKTAYFSLALALFLRIGTIYASEPTTSVKSENKKPVIIITLPALSPLTPKEAGFHDLKIEGTGIVHFISPVTPKEASFDENTSGSIPIDEETVNSLAPVAPKETVFDDEIQNGSADISALAPVTPKEADFSDD